MEEQKDEIKDKENNLKNESLINSPNEEYNDDIIIISTKNKLFRCINHNRIFKNKEGLISHCREKHKFRCGECGQFFGIKRKMNKHLKFCKNNELKGNQIKCTECDLFFDDVESMSIHFYKIHDKNNQNNIEEKNISQKIKLEEDLNINNKNNKDEKSLIEKYKDLNEEENINKNENIINEEKKMK